MTQETFFVFLKIPILYVQFFSSKKKKKFVSPLSKSGKVEPNAKLSVQGSPGAKGSLSSYLVSSQNEDPSLTTLPTADNQDHVRRNLTSAIQSSDSVELQQFATNFLSYYCRCLHL